MAAVVVAASGVADSCFVGGDGRVRAVMSAGAAAAGMLRGRRRLERNRHERSE